MLIHTRKRSKFLFLALLVLFSLKAHADEYRTVNYDDEFGSGFVGVEGGIWRFLGSGRSVVTDPIVVYITTGFSLKHALGMEGDDDTFTVGPKIGIVAGSLRGPAQDPKLSYDLLGKIRFTLGTRGSTFRPYIDAGPGFVNFARSAFEIEAGGGIDFCFGSGSIGFNSQYKELFGSGAMKRGIVFLGTLAYRF